MTKIIANPKNYTGDELSTVFFRPILGGQNAQSLGIRVLYNLPTPTTIGFWGGSDDILKSYSKGWQGDVNSKKFQKTLDLKKVKAEMSYAAADYFSMVYEKIACNTQNNMGDLSGTELETAETEIFKASIAESLRATMWVGDSSRAGGFNTFDGIIKRVKNDVGTDQNSIKKNAMPAMTTADNAEKLFKSLLESADPKLKAIKSEGQFVIFATGDVVANYENSLTSGNNDAARFAKINGIDKLTYSGVEIVDMGVDKYLSGIADLPKSFALLTDRRNIVLAVNTNDLPGAEVAMWYNPDELENRQRATFLAGADYLLPELVVVAFTTV